MRIPRVSKCLIPGRESLPKSPCACSLLTTRVNLEAQGWPGDCAIDCERSRRKNQRAQRGGPGDNIYHRAAEQSGEVVIGAKCTHLGKDACESQSSDHRR